MHHRHRILLFLLLTCCGLLSGCSHPSPYTAATQRAADARIDLGLAYLKHNNPDKARLNLHKAMTLTPHYLRANLAYGYYLERVGNFDQCDTLYRQWLETFPNNSYLLNNYGSYLCRQQRFALAQQQFRTAIALPNSPNIATLYENAGLCQLLNQQYQPARQSLLKALNYDPQRLTSLKQLIQLERNAGQHRQAEQHLRQYQSLTDHSVKLNHVQPPLNLLTP